MLTQTYVQSKTKICKRIRKRRVTTIKEETPEEDQQVRMNSRKRIEKKTEQKKKADDTS